MKTQYFTLSILIYIIFYFYSCSAVSRTKHITCKERNYHINGKHKLSPWKTIRFKVHFKHRRRIPGVIHIAHSKYVSCTLTYNDGLFLTKSCTNWSFARRKTLKYRIKCRQEPVKKQT